MSYSEETQTASAENQNFKGRLDKEYNKDLHTVVFLPGPDGKIRQVINK